MSDSENTGASGGTLGPRQPPLVGETPCELPVPCRTVEEWAKEAGTPDWLFAGAKCGNRWPLGKTMTRAEYDAAIDRAANVTIR